MITHQVVRLKRYGVEFANWYTPTNWLTLDADYAWSKAYFTDSELGGDYVPEALAATFDGGLAVHNLDGWARNLRAGLRLRYFGPRSLTQSDSVRSRATSLFYGDIGYRIDRTWTIGLDVFNILNTKSSDIDYYYTSRVPGEPLSGVNDIHSHPSEPRDFRISLTVSL